MAVLGKFNNASVTINSVDLSAFVRSVTINVNRSEEEISAMGDTSYAEFTIGRGDWSVDVEFWQSYYTAEVDATIEPLIDSPGSGTTISILPKPSVSGVNPNYNGTVYCTGYAPIDGEYDSNLSTSVSFRGTGALTRSTS